MNSAQARQLGRTVASHLIQEDPSSAYQVIRPVLKARTPFRYLDVIGAQAATSGPRLDDLLAEIAQGRSEGGWVIIGSTLRHRLSVEPSQAFALCRHYAVVGDVWYAADILAERVPGPALVGGFDKALDLLAPWRGDANRWVRKMVGVAVHFWAKRSRGAPELAPRAAKLLEFLEPLYEERDLDAAKGVGWGLKTLGRTYPSLTADWLAWQRHRRCRAVVLRKALIHLPRDDRWRVTGD